MSQEMIPGLWIGNAPVFGEDVESRSLALSLVVGSGMAYSSWIGILGLIRSLDGMHNESMRLILSLYVKCK